MDSKVLNLTACPISVCGNLIRPYDAIIIDLPSDFTYNKKTLAVEVLHKEKVTVKEVSKNGQKRKRRTSATNNIENNKKESE